jgi:hypothetical protein
MEILYGFFQSIKNFTYDGGCYILPYIYSLIDNPAYPINFHQSERIAFLPEDRKNKMFTLSRTCTMEEAIDQYGYSNILNSRLEVAVYDYGSYFTSTYHPDENVTPKTFLNFPVASEKDFNYNNVDFIYCLTLDFYPTYSNGLYR